MLTYLAEKWRALRNVAKPVTNPATVDYKQMAENSLDLILRIGADDKVTYASPSSLTILGYTPEEMIRLGAKHYMHPDDAKALSPEGQKLRSKSIETKVAAFRVIRKDGTERWLEGSGCRLAADQAGGPNDLLVSFRDVTERKQLEIQLAALALTDGLTGLANRRAFDETLERSWRFMLRESGQMALLLIDVDFFKRFNDTYGHQVGDECLRAAASAIKTALLRPADFAARYGGEEFAVILPVTDEIGAVDVAERIRSAVQALRVPHEHNPAGQGYVSISIGVAAGLALPGTSIASSSSLIAAADRALYAAKQGGRNQVARALLLSSSMQDIKE